MGRTLIGGTAVATATASTSSQSWQEKQTEGYPIFGMWGSDGGNQYQAMQMYDSTFSVKGTPHGAKTGTTSSYQFGNYSDGAMGYQGDFTANYATNAQLTSQPYSSSYWVQANRNNTVFPMHEYIDLSPAGSWRSVYGTNNTSTLSTIYRKYWLMNWVLPEGRRPRKFLSVENQYINQFSDMKRMPSKHLGRRFTWTTWLQTSHPVIYAAITATAQSWYGAGNASYNERTNKLMISWQTSTTNQHCAILIAGEAGKLLSSPDVTPTEWFEAATPVSWTNWTMAFNTGTANDTRYDHKIMLGDNDKAAIFNHQAASNMYMCLMDWNSGSAGSHTYDSTYTSVSTGGYSSTNGQYYHTRFQSTWDQNWHMAFTGTYQEGCGMAGLIVSTKDPSRVFKYRHAVNIGYGVLPIGKSSFMFHAGENTDSSTKPGGIISLGATSQVGTADTTYSYSSGVISLSIVNKGTLTSVGQLQSGINNLKYTTDYPTFITCNWWPKDDYIFGSPSSIDY